ncbi:MAG: ankyrin repeat domain-containing protein [Candidatus Wallbacteria bacterium]|nr:ankyrin repeat domain-containing protein [Candidatus Wallbacteria bacterium]
MKYVIGFFLIILVIAIITSIERKVPILTSEQARKALDERGINFSADNFIEKVLKNDLEAVRLLIQAGINPNLSFQGRPLLAIVFDRMDLDMAKILIENKTDKNQMLLFAVTDNNPKLLKFVLGYKADILTESKDKKTLMDLCISRPDSEEVAVMLLEKKCYISDVQESLVTFSELGWTQAAKIMLDRQADVNYVDQKGYTPMVYATLKGQTEMVRFLASNKGNINFQDKNGISILMIASKLGVVDILKFLLSANADVNLKDKKGRTALSVASSDFVREMLKKAGAQQ